MIIRKQLTLLSSCFVFSSFGFLHAQVGVNTNPPHSSAIFDMSDSKRGFLPPRVALESLTDVNTIDNPKDGLLVFNTTTTGNIAKGYYFWNAQISQWDPFYNTVDDEIRDVSDLAYASTLGYSPYGKMSRTPDEFTFGGVTASKLKCAAFKDDYKDAKEHYYCTYTLDQNINWGQAFKMAKFLQSYIAVITTTNEWDFVRDELLAGGDTPNNIWIGYNTIQYPGNNRQFTWITGEKSTINWSNASDLQVNYAKDKVFNANPSGCVYIKSSASSPAREWEVANCASQTLEGSPINHLLIELNNE